jgi:hypothetical protein
MAKQKTTTKKTDSKPKAKKVNPVDDFKKGLDSLIQLAEKERHDIPAFKSWYQELQRMYTQAKRFR